MNQLTDYSNLKDKIQEQESKVQDLIQQFRELTDNYLYEAYLILRQIYDIRKAQIKDYSYTDLGMEKGIDLDRNRVRYIFAFAFMSESTKKRLENKQLKPSTILTVINRNVDMQQPEIQDGLFNKYLNKEITMQNVTNWSSQILLNVAKDKDSMTEERRLMLQTVYHLRSVRNTIKEHKHLITEDIKGQIIEEIILVREAL